MNWNLTGAQGSAFHHGEDLYIEKQHQQVAEADGAGGNHFPAGLTDAADGGDSDRNQRCSLTIGEPLIKGSAHIGQTPGGSRAGRRGAVDVRVIMNAAGTGCGCAGTSL